MLVRVPVFLVALLIVRGVPALLYRPIVGARRVGGGAAPGDLAAFHRGGGRDRPRARRDQRDHRLRDDRCRARLRRDLPARRADPAAPDVATRGLPRRTPPRTCGTRPRRLSTGPGPRLRGSCSSGCATSPGTGRISRILVIAGCRYRTVSNRRRPTPWGSAPEPTAALGLRPPETPKRPRSGLMNGPTIDEPWEVEDRGEEPAIAVL